MVYLSIQDQREWHNVCAHYFQSGPSSKYSLPIIMKIIQDLPIGYSRRKMFLNGCMQKGQKFVKRVRGFRFIATFSDRKSTRLNSSHVAISYAVFCLKKKTL